MIDEIIKQLEPLINGKLIYLSQYGSHLYGLNTENSDLDFRGVYIPTIDDIILKKDKDEINTELEIYLPPEPLQQKEHVLGEIYMQPIVSEKGKQVNANRDNLKKVDVKLFSLQKFIQLCSKADTNALDLLFSWTNQDTESYLYAVSDYINPMAQIVTYKNKLINTDRLESPITYAFKQATKYSIKGNYIKLLDCLIELSDKLIVYNVEEFTKYIGELLEIEKDKLFIVTRDMKEKGGMQKFLSVLGVEHQFNLSMDKFKQRLQQKRNSYSDRSIQSGKDGGNDWKALSHAIRVLLEVKELLDTGNIQFPLKDKKFLLDIKLGKIEREFIDNFFNQELSNILERVQKNELNWKYDEELWNEFILKDIKNGKNKPSNY